MFTSEKNFDIVMKFFVRCIFLSVSTLSTLFLTAPARSQSTNQSFPTPVSSGEISGSIKPRDVGDARLTSYYYQFDGDQGDLFINVVTRNFTGDIDVFTQSGLKPLTKIVVYADFAESETGRVLYLRKPEKMMLRIQGRPPGDDPATFRIKFAGSFVASSQAEPAGEPTLPTLTAKTESGIRVNSVGTIVEIIPKATPTPLGAETSAADEERSELAETEKEKAERVADTKNEEKPSEPVAETTKKMGVVVTDNVPATHATTTPPAATARTRGRRNPPRRTPPAEPPVATTPGDTPAKKPPVTGGRRRTPPKAAATEPDPMASVNLVILFKDGAKIERPMSEVLRFTVDKGVLTVISKDGTTGRYSILDVARLTVQ